MNRFDVKAREAERKVINDMAEQKPFAIMEPDDSGIILKFLYAQPYIKADLLEYSKWYCNNVSKEQLAVVDKVHDLETAMKDFQLETNNPIFILYGKSEYQWVLMCIVYDNQTKSTVVLYKDPSGLVMPNDLTNKIKEIYRDGVTFVNHLKIEIEDDEDKLYGPLCIRNLNMCLQYKNNLSNNVKEKFQRINFYTPKNINKTRLQCAYTMVRELSTNGYFKSELKKLVDQLPSQLFTDILDYYKILEHELPKEEKNVDFNKIEKKRKYCLVTINIKIFGDNFKRIGDEEYELEMQKELSRENSNLQIIFMIINDLETVKEQDAVFLDVSKALKIDIKKLKLLYTLHSENKVKVVADPLKPIDIKTIKLAKVKIASPEGNTLQDLLKLIATGMDTITSPLSIDIEQIKHKFENVQKIYLEWKNRDLHAINIWAKGKKRRLENRDEDICEAIAIMNRAFDLIKGLRFHDPQILAVLIFFHDKHNQGKICEIKAGEGKVLVASLLAVIRVLQGSTVDIITSSSPLAAKCAKDIKEFYSVFDLKVATNNPEPGTRDDSKIGYRADILYGTLSNFQLDYLKDATEGSNIRQGRKFQQIIFDEIDGMLIDNREHTVELATSYPGMESLKYIYIKIWQELIKAEKNFVKETQTQIEQFLKEHASKKDAVKEYDILIQEIIKNEKTTLKKKIRISNPTNVLLIHRHLREYANSKLEMWLESALQARYIYHENQQYRIITNDIGEKDLVPTNYLNTGVIWSNGLRQFLQLKHNLTLTSESLIGSFISNMGYIKNYDSKNIFGLTGTLGSQAEQEFISDLYNLSYAKLPTNKNRKFKELPCLVVDDHFWHIQITLEIMNKIGQKRSVLVICRTESDVLTIENNLQILKNNGFKILFAAKNDCNKISDQTIITEQVILTTNIADRNINFKTVDSLEDKGGLHVCVGFLPCNLRAEEQAFERTSCQGKSGSAQFVIRQSEVNNLGISNKNPKSNTIKEKRDHLENERLEEIEEGRVLELNFKDRLFNYFAIWYKNLKKEKETKDYLLLQDLKESWAFWLEKKTYTGNTLGSKTPEQEYFQFYAESQSIIEDNKIQHNPFYCISLADYFMENDDIDAAYAVLCQAIDMSNDENHELLAGAYLKLYEIAISGDEHVLIKFKEAVVKEPFFEPFFQILSLQVRKVSKENKLKYLETAKRSIGKEITYIETLLGLQEESSNLQLANILTEESKNNLFLKHIYCRLYCLYIHSINIARLIAETSKNYIMYIDVKLPTTLENLKKIDTKFTNYITELELSELQSVGINAIYSSNIISNLPPLPPELVKNAIILIDGGISALRIGVSFQFIFPTMQKIAGLLICEGLMNIAKILLRGAEKFDKKDYLNMQFVLYGTSSINENESAFKQSASLLKKALIFCRTSSTLYETTYLKEVCNKTFPSTIQLIDVQLEDLSTITKFNELTKIEQLNELTRLQTMKDFKKFNLLGGTDKLEKLKKLKLVLGAIKELTQIELMAGFVKVKKTKTETGEVEFMLEKKVMKPLTNLILKDLIKKLKQDTKEKFKEKMRENENLMTIFQTTPIEDIENTCDKFVENYKKMVKEIAEKMIGGFLKKLNNTVIDVMTLSYAYITDIKEINEDMHLCVPLIFDLENNLKSGSKNNNVDVVLEKICTKVSHNLFFILLDTLERYIKFSKNYFKKEKTETNISIIISSLPILDGSEENPYSVLGLPQDTNIAEVQKTFQKLILQIHSDMNPNDPVTTENLQKIKNAYKKINAS